MERDKETPDDYADYYGSIAGKVHEAKQGNFQICQSEFFNIGHAACRGRLGETGVILL